MELKKELHNQTPSLEGITHAVTTANARQMQLIETQ